MKRAVVGTTTAFLVVLAFISACGSDDSSRVTGTAVVAPCPTISAAPTDARVSHDVTGKFTEECVRSIIKQPFVVADLSPDWTRGEFGFSTDEPIDLRVFYEPSDSSRPRVLLEIWPKGQVLPTGGAFTTQAGHQIRLAQSPTGYMASWDLGASFYAVTVLDGDASEDNREVLGAAADSIYSRATN